MEKSESEERKRYIVYAGLAAVAFFACNCFCQESEPEHVTAPSESSIHILDELIQGSKRLVPGVFLGVRDDGRLYTKSLKRDGHIVVFGQTGSYKTSSIVNPTMETAGNGFNVYLDVKGELYARWQQLYGSDSGRKCLIFDPYCDEKSNCWYDPFAPMKHDPEHLADHAFQLAKTLIAAIPNNYNQVWTDTAIAFTTGVIIDSFNAKLSFAETMERINIDSVKKIIGSVLVNENSAAKSFVSKLPDMDTRTIANIGMELVNNLAMFTASDAFRKAFSGSEGKELLDWDDLNKDVPFDVILCLSEDRLDALTPVYRTMVDQLITSLMRRKRRTYDSTDLPPVLIMLDEVAQLGRLPSLEHGLATLRCRGVTMVLFLQSLASLSAVYGEKSMRSILENCEYKAILGSTEVESQAYFSKLLGTQIVQRNSTTISGLHFGVSRTYSYERENVIQPHEFHANEPICLYKPDGYEFVKKIPVFNDERVFQKVKEMITNDNSRL